MICVIAGETVTGSAMLIPPFSTWPSETSPGKSTNVRDCKSKSLTWLVMFEVSKGEEASIRRLVRAINAVWAGPCTPTWRRNSALLSLFHYAVPRNRMYSSPGISFVGFSGKLVGDAKHSLAALPFPSSKGAEVIKTGGGHTHL